MLMTLTKKQQIILLVALVAILIALRAYQAMIEEKPQTAQLVYTSGMKVKSPVRRGLQQPGEGQDVLSVFLARRVEHYPGVSRDLFRVSAPKPKPIVKPQPVIVAQPTMTGPPPKSPEEIAAEIARADLSTFRFLGYLTDKDSSLFLSKDGELFIAKSGDTLLKNYRIKSAGKDHVILYDAATKVEVRVDLTGSDGKAK